MTMPAHGDQSTYYPLNSAEPLRSPIGLCSDAQLWYIAQHMRGDWETLSALLGVPQRDIDIIRQTHSQVVDQTFATLQGWRWRALKWRCPDEAVPQLIGTLSAVGDVDIANYLEEQFKLTESLP
ncbi:uncharacterized protein [Antedon mediterranea]|uniref:uncharacterized protein n=1 Tax=Antedon mediterranea TaxID=105859 RepID=UPI003AF53AD0